MISSYNFTGLKQKTQDPLYKFQCSLTQSPFLRMQKKKISTVAVVNAIVLLQCVRAEIYSNTFCHHSGQR